jgi:hypothetical protein
MVIVIDEFQLQKPMGLITCNVSVNYKRIKTYQIDELDEKDAKVDNDLLSHVVHRSTESHLVVLEQVIDEPLLVIKSVAVLVGGVGLCHSAASPSRLARSLNAQEEDNKQK